MSNHFDLRLAELNGRLVDAEGDCVIYWMQRSQRAFENAALSFAVRLANDLSKPLLTYFGLYDRYPMASRRAFQFMLEGLAEVGPALSERGIGFLIRREHPATGIVRAASELRASAVVVDEDYLNVGREWRREAARELGVRLIQVDAETVVPARVSGKEEWGAYTLRPKIAKLLPECLSEPEEPAVLNKWAGHPAHGIDLSSVKPMDLASALDVDQDVRPTPYFVGGASEARRRLRHFIETDLPRYATERNEIGLDVSSRLSPYFHFGQISSLRVALIVETSDAPRECIDAFLEQLIVRRELAINLCLYNPLYDRLDAAADWARATLDAHRSDQRKEIYDLEELEEARTHDDLWNASQTELVKFGKVHPYLRMVWAKRLLEWSPTPEEALRRAIYLNDKYALDGRDPNGYANIAWCMFGKHDRPFAERPVFGKVRYMSTSATMRKTRWQDYLNRVRAL